jgi:hypothetical protein
MLRSPAQTADFFDKGQLSGNNNSHRFALDDFEYLIGKV